MGTDTTERELVSTQIAARLLGASVVTVRRAARDGRLHAVRLGPRGWLRFRRDELERLLAEPESHASVGARDAE